MPQYDLYVSCTECNNVHPMGIGIHLNAGPPDQTSIEEAYEYNSVPPQIQAVEGHRTLCLKTGKMVRTKGPKKNIFKAEYSYSATTETGGVSSMAFQNILPCIDTNSMNITSVRFVSREI